MIDLRGSRLWSGIAVVLLGSGVVAPIRAAALPERLEALRRQAVQFEKEGQWARACESYAEILVKDRNLSDIKKHYQTCLRHFYLVRRHRDRTFREQVVGRDVSVALKVYAEVLGKLKANYLDRSRSDWNSLFEQGIEELRLALDDDVFRQEYLAAPGPDAFRAFQAQLEDRGGRKKVGRLQEAQDQALEVALAAKKTLGLKPAVAVLEMVCGACNSLDEYTLFLTPGLLSDMIESLDGELVGVGVDVSILNSRLEVVQVLTGGPAFLAGIKRGDQILRIDHKPVRHLDEEAVRERLRGQAGSTVELEILSAGTSEPRVLTMTRQPLRVLSVLDVRMRDDQAGVGYLRLSGFQKTTPEEIDSAILTLKMQGMKALILDLRENPGGSFPVAVQVAERFLASGIIVSMQSRLTDYNRTYEANNLNAVLVPLVVLVDGETASAAEVLAGALKENQRATLVGQPTFGKGTIQGILQLDTMPSGIRLTVARFFSPHGHAYAGSGVTPHILVERTSAGFEETQLQAALEAARQLAMMQR